MKLCIPLVVLTLLIPLCYAAEPTRPQRLEPSPAEMAEQIRQLQQQVADLQAQSAGPSDSTEATKQAVSRDTEVRSHFFAAAVSAPTTGYDKGFFIQSEDKRFSIKPGFSLQVRHDSTWRQDGKNFGTEDDIQNGLEIRRAKFWVEGNAHGPDITYRLQIANQKDASGLILDDAWIGYKLNDAWSLRVGQMKAPFSLEDYVIFDVDQAAVDRSLMNDLIGEMVYVERVQGLSAYWKNQRDTLHAVGMLSDGEGSANTDFRDAVSPDTRSRIGFFGRADYKLFGGWKEQSLATAKGTKEDTLVVGAGFSANDAPNNAIYRGELFGHYVIGGKWNFIAGVAEALTDPRNLPATPTRFDYGGLAEASYLLNPCYEVFGRFDITVQDQDVVTGEHIYPETTVGIIRYLGPEGSAGNAARLTLDLSYLPSGVPANRTGLGELENNGKNEIVARVQFQLKV